MTNREARAFLDQVDAWMASTGTLWGHLCAAAQVAASTRGSVRDRGMGMMRQTAAKLSAIMEKNPGGLVIEDVTDTRHWLSPAETQQFAAELKAWLERTGTVPWRIATAAGRDARNLLHLIESPRKISPRTVARYREIMAAHPDCMGEPSPHHGAMTLGHVAPPPFVDPLEARRGEADRMRKEWIAQQAAEHERKYGRPLGRPIEEMAA